LAIPSRRLEASVDRSGIPWKIRKAAFLVSALVALACLLAMMGLYLERPPLLTQTVITWSHFTVMIFWVRFFGIVFASGAILLLAPRILSLVVGSILGVLLVCELIGWGLALSTPYHFCSLYCSNLLTPAESIGGQFLSGLMLPEDMEVHTHDYSTIFLASLVFFSLWSASSLRRAAQATSLLALPLPVSIYLFDRREFGLHAADVLANAGVGWLTNEFLLFALSAILVASTLWPAYRSS